MRCWGRPHSRLFYNGSAMSGSYGGRSFKNIRLITCFWQHHSTWPNQLNWMRLRQGPSHVYTISKLLSINNEINLALYWWCSRHGGVEWWLQVTRKSFIQTRKLVSGQDHIAGWGKHRIQARVKVSCWKIISILHLLICLYGLIETELMYQGLNRAKIVLKEAIVLSHREQVVCSVESKSILLIREVHLHILPNMLCCCVEHEARSDQRLHAILQPCPNKLIAFPPRRIGLYQSLQEEHA